MIHILTISSQTFMLLRREKIFFPALVLLVAISFFAQIASEWGGAESHKILFDVGMLGFHLVGNFVAIFWGTKLINDALTSGLLETQLGTGLARSSWLLGNFFGLAISLLVLGGLVSFAWQGMMFVNGMGLMNWSDTSALIAQILGWLVLAALAICLSTVLRFEVALFASLGLWIIGLSSKAVEVGLSAGDHATLMDTAQRFSRYFDLQRFNLDYWQQDVVSHEFLWNVGFYGLALIGLFLTTSLILFEKRDLVK